MVDFLTKPSNQSCEKRRFGTETFLIKWVSLSNKINVQQQVGVKQQLLE
jgi:hypothetical protein